MARDADRPGLVVMRPLRVAGATLVLALLGLGAAPPASAQTLEQLGVRSFDLSVDRSDVAVGDTLDVVLDVKMAKPVSQLNNVTLPQLFGFDVVGDERSCVGSTGSGSECTERIKISPTRAGELVVGPAVLVALDAQNRPTRYQSNYVTIRVVENPNAQSSDDPIGQLFAPIMHFLLLGLIVVVVAVVAFFAVILLLARRLAKPGAPLPVAPPMPPPGPPPVDPELRFAALVQALEDEPTRMRALALRAELRARVGAREDETLADLMARRAGNDRVLNLLAIVERAAFVEEAYVAAAAREAVTQLRAMMSSSPTGGTP